MGIVVDLSLTFLWSSADADGPAPLELPNQWLWDIIDEFIYQVAGQPWLNLKYSITRPNKEQLLTVVCVIKDIGALSVPF